MSMYAKYLGISGNLLVCVTWLGYFPHTSGKSEITQQFIMARYYHIWPFSCSVSWCYMRRPYVSGQDVCP